MASSSSNSTEYVTPQVGEDYPCHSHVCAGNFVTCKLSVRYEYSVWKTHMLCLLESQGMLGFVDETLANSLPRRSDALVKGWILGSLTKQTLMYVFDRLKAKHPQRPTADFTAKVVWDELQRLYGPVVDKQDEEANLKTQEEDADLENQEEANLEVRSIKARLSDAIRVGNWADVNSIVQEDATVIDKVIINGNTALHVAVGTTKSTNYLEEILSQTPKNTQLALKNSDGSTLLHVAVIVGNTFAAKLLLERTPDLLLEKDKEEQTPLAIALSNMHNETSQLLLKYIQTDDQKKDALFSGTSGDELLVTVISSKDFHLANQLAKLYKTLHGDAVLIALAKNFPCDSTDLYGKIKTSRKSVKQNNISAKNNTNSTDGENIKTSKPTEEQNVTNDGNINTSKRKVRNCLISAVNKTNEYLPYAWMKRKSSLIYRAILEFGRRFYKMLGGSDYTERARIYKEAIELLKKVCELMVKKNEDSNGSIIKATRQYEYYNDSIIEATRHNAYEVVHHIVYIFPEAIFSENEDGHNIIQYSVISRSEKIYNLLYQMNEHKNIYRTMRDAQGNNLLHLAARLSPINKLNLIPGAALQIQHELQWFKEVEAFSCPLSRTQTNYFNETPKMIFTREHKELVAEGEKWMKTTAKSFTIAAALITTIVFAAAITVPGGYNQDLGEKDQHTTGLPVFTKSTAFTIFAVSDAISLLAAVTSLLMFLSILTARFAEEDFLHKLPLKLIVGSATLFISTTAMVIAGGATVYLVFGQSKLTVLIITSVLICIQVAIFLILQFRLVKDLFYATYGPSIFGKKYNHPFY